MDKRIEHVLPGEILAASVMDSAGRLLFPKGATLTESAIAALRQRGVTDLVVVGEKVPLNAELLEKATERARKYYAGHDLGKPPGPILLEPRRCRSGRACDLLSCSSSTAGRRNRTVRVRRGRPCRWAQATESTRGAVANGNSAATRGQTPTAPSPYVGNGALGAMR